MLNTAGPKIVTTAPMAPLTEAAPGSLSPENEAALRQLSHQRLMGYGVDYGDATELRALAASGVDWQEAATGMAEALLRRLAEIDPPLSTQSRRDVLYRASALLRMSQMMMVADSDERRSIYRRAAAIFEEAMSFASGVERIILSAGQGKLVGWHYRASREGPGPAVLVIGGIEGWAMDLDCIGRALSIRGVDALLLDGPGQGETRFEFGHFLDRNWRDTYSSVVDILADLNGGGPIGVLGNSMGGSFAMLLAGTDPRIAACGNNGGIQVPLGQRARRNFFPKMEAFCAAATDEEIDAIWETVEVTEERMTLTCPLLIVQGGLDPLVSVEESTRMLGWARSPDKQMHVFTEGDHCIYNRPSDKLDLIGDWFLDRLK